MSLPILLLLSSLVLGSAALLRRPERRGPESAHLEAAPAPAPAPARRRAAPRAYSGTVRVEFADRAGARDVVERLLRRQATRVEIDAIRPLAGGRLAAEYQVQFAVRRDRDRIAGQLLEEARPFVRSAELS